VDDREREPADEDAGPKPQQLVQDAVVPGQIRQVERQHRARQARAEAEGERAGQHGPQGSIHEPQA
jgi:hypothetical protein